MKTSRRYVVRYLCDECGDHTAEENLLTGERDMVFSDQVDALHFLGECSSKIKNFFIVEVDRDILLDSSYIDNLIQAEYENDYYLGL